MYRVAKERPRHSHRWSLALLKRALANLPNRSIK